MQSNNQHVGKVIESRHQMVPRVENPSSFRRRVASSPMYIYQINTLHSTKSPLSATLPQNSNHGFPTTQTPLNATRNRHPIRRPRRHELPQTEESRGGASRPPIAEPRRRLPLHPHSPRHIPFRVHHALPHSTKTLLLPPSLGPALGLFNNRLLIGPLVVACLGRRRVPPPAHGTGPVPGPACT